MATRSRRVEYVFDQRTTNLATTTRLDFSAITITIAETSSRVFRSVYVEVQGQDNTAASGTITATLIGIKLAAVAFDDATSTGRVGGAGDGYGFKYTRDVTSYFTTNFGSGTTQTCQVGVKFTGTSTNNITVKLVINYEFDDTSATTRTKTVKIPLESKTGALSQVLSEIGTNQVPNLSTFLPEASITYKSVWFEVIANTAASGTTDANLELALDAEAGVSMGTEEMGGQDERWTRHIWRRDDMSTSATHAFKARTTNASLLYSCAAVFLCVTYTYDHSTTTTVLNSIELMVTDGGFIGRYTSATPTKLTTSFEIQEPSSISLKQSAVMLLALASTPPVSFSVACGSQTARSYTPDSGPNGAAPMTVMQRVDSGGAQGAGITLARGTNTFSVSVYVTDINVYPHGNHSGILYLNYTSGMATLGDGVHNHTLTFFVAAWNAANAGGGVASLSEYTSIQPQIPETNYFLTNVGVSLGHHQSGQDYGSYTDIETKTTDVIGVQSWRPIYGAVSFGEYADAYVQYYLDITKLWRSHPTKLLQSDRLDIEVSRTWRVMMLGTYDGSKNIHLSITYHAFQFLVEGVVSAYGGAGTGIAVVAYDASTHEAEVSSTTTTGGAYSMTVYSDRSFYVASREDDTHCGRSTNGTPTAA